MLWTKVISDSENNKTTYASELLPVQRFGVNGATLSVTA